MTAQNIPAATAAAPRPPSAVRRGARRAAAAAVAGAGAGTILVMALSALPASAALQVNCAAAPSKCGYRDATNTGVPDGTRLLTVPSQVSSGPGWSFSTANQAVNVTGNNAVLSGLSIPYNVNITASGVTINDDQIVTSASFAVSLRHTTGVTIENSTISGTNATTGRVGSAICDLYGDSTAMVIKNNDISAFRTGAQASSGMVSGNYIHDPGFIAGDHTNGVYVGGGTQPMTISGNTILNPLGQTDAINLDASAAGQPVANKTIENNLLAGGSYTIYGGDALSNITSAILIKGNRFGQAYYPKAGQYGPVAYYDPAGTANTWTANTWDITGQAISAP